MSAVYGCVDLNLGKVTKETADKMTKAFSTCVIDRYEEILDGHVFMGCGLQYFTPESRKERLPIKEGKIYFTADVFLDNRDELIEKLQKDHIVIKSGIPDGEILYLFYRQYGREGLNDILGSYAFVYYDAGAQFVDIVTDVTANRSIYYWFQEGVLYFSTLMLPIVKVIPRPEISDEWMAEYLAIEDYRPYIDAKLTPYAGVLKVSNARVLHITCDTIQEYQYWKPLETRKKLKLANDDAYKKCFKELYQKCVRSVMRSDKETGIFLSGGLDSTSVACLAAPILKREGKMLHSYTMIPAEGLTIKKNAYEVYDETPWVKETKRFLDNLDDHYMSFEGLNCWNIIDEMVSNLEFAYKSLQNSMWITQMGKKAYEDGCRVVLSGQGGNNTVSYGNFGANFVTLWRGGHFIHFIHEINICHKKYNFSRKKMIKKTWKDCRLERIEDTREDFISRSFVKKSLIDQYDISDKLHKDAEFRMKIRTVTDYYPIMVDEMYFRQAGEIETHQSLYTGVITKDPTRDKRMIEWILSLPPDQFVKDGCDRRLIREYMKEEMPMEFVQDILHRGRQAQDTWFRFQKDWKEAYFTLKEYFTNIQNEAMGKYVECDKILQMLATFSGEEDIILASPEKIHTLEKIFYVYIAGCVCNLIS